MILENSPKIAKAFGRVQFKRIYKPHEQRKSLIARVFIWLPFYYMTEKNKNAPCNFITVLAGGARRMQSPPATKIMWFFGQNAKDSGNETWEKT